MEGCTEIKDAQQGGWRANLGVGFAARDGATVVRDRWHRGPLQVQRAFYPEGADLCHLYVLHPPGGLVDGDALAIEVRVDAGARALVTTPAAGKAYRSRSVEGGASQHHRLQVGATGSLEWLPQETIAFDGARVSLATRVDLEPGAIFIGWEILCLGRPAAGETFARGRCRQRFELWRAGRPLCVERATLAGGGVALHAAWGLRGAAVTGTMLAAGSGLDDPALLAAARAAAAAVPAGELASVSLLDGVLVGRYLGGSAERARSFFARVWAVARPVLLGRRAIAPRIWAT